MIRNNHAAPATLLALVLLTAVVPATARGGQDGPDPPYSQTCSFEVTGDSLVATLPVTSYEIQRTRQADEIVVPDFGRLLVPGKPDLPSRIFALAIPPGAQVVEVSFDAGEGVTLPGVYNVAPAPLPRVIGREDPAIYEARRQEYDRNVQSVYGSDDAYPEQVVEHLRNAHYREYNLVDVRVTPFTYRPLSGRLTYYPNITVEVRYTLPDSPLGVMQKGSARTERLAGEIVLNYGQAQQWYSQEGQSSRGLHDFVIITLDSLTIAVAPLVSWETSKGRTVEVVTTSWIASSYTGYDLAAEIRMFLRDKYPSGEWGIEDVLLVGHYDDVVMRRTAQDLGYGEPETDYYYAELSLPDDQSWDDDEDHQYGENSDPIDFYAEVNVGRIPYSDSGTVSSICNKSVAYEQNDSAAFKKNMLLLGGFFWENTDNAELMEAKIDQPWMTDWTFTRMYEQNSTVYSTFPCDYELRHSTVQSVWPAGTYAFVNWAGHGSPTSSHIMGYSSEAFITSSDCALLNDDYPAIIFADACSNHDTDYNNIGRAMLGQGAVGFLGSTKVALGCPGWSDEYDGSSQSLDYFFTTSVTSGNYTQGEGHQWALRQMYTYGLWDYLRYETFEWGALLGNPNLGMGTAAALNISLPDGPPEYLAPGVPTTFTVQITDGSESYVPGTGTLHYRYDGGTFLTSGLDPEGLYTYNATLPAAACEDTPEFYVSAEGDGGTTVTSPGGAPTSVYTATVGGLITLFADNFETDAGWTTDTVNSPTSGLWERGTPVNDPSWEYDPASDSDGSGQCYLTQNELGNTDVDGGNVLLISPTLDMSGGNINISYDYFLRLTDTTGGVDRLLVEINNDGGSGTWTEIARHDTNGGLSWRSNVIDQDDLDAAGVTLTSTMVLRFDTNDADPQSINESGLDAFVVSSFACEAPGSCTNGILDTGEDRIDCGGPCPPCECTSDGQCGDGTYCDGAETCDAYGYCQEGTPVDCPDDGFFCNGTEFCDEGADTCGHTGDPCVPPEVCDEQADMCVLEYTTIDSAASCQDHGGQEYCLDMAMGRSATIEPRLGGVTKLMLQTVDPVEAGSTTASAICVNNVYNGTITVTADGTTTVQVDPDPFPDQDCCTIDFTGGIEDSIDVQLLAGDVDSDVNVSTADGSSITQRLGIALDGSNFWYDVDLDQNITTADGSFVTQRLGNVAPFCP